MSGTIQTLATAIYPSVALPIDSLAATVVNNEDSKPSTIAFTYQGVTYTLTFSYDGDGNCTGFSQYTPPEA